MGNYIVDQHIVNSWTGTLKLSWFSIAVEIGKNKSSFSFAWLNWDSTLNESAKTEVLRHKGKVKIPRSLLIDRASLEQKPKFHTLQQQ